MAVVQATEDANGKRTYRVNKIGRNARSDGKSSKEIRDEEYIKIARKLKGHVSNAIIQAAKILDLDAAKPMEKLAASKLILGEYMKAIDAVYKDTDEDDAPKAELQKETAPVFSLTVIKDDKEV